jgi:hypothetical protein
MDGNVPIVTISMKTRMVIIMMTGKIRRRSTPTRTKPSRKKTYPPRCVLYAIDHLHGGKNGSVVGMKSRHVRKNAMVNAVADRSTIAFQWNYN